MQLSVLLEQEEELEEATEDKSDKDESATFKCVSQFTVLVIISSI
jgi:hypothetical protein